MNWKWVVMVYCLSACLTGAAGAADFDFSGSVTFADIGQYIYLDFAVPAGVTKIHFAYTYAPATDNTDAAADTPINALFNNVMDIGVFDPDGYRGWSGSNKHSFSIAQSREQTTPSYIPGEIQEGTWQVELGVGWVDPGTTLDYNVTIDLSGDSVGPVFTPPEYTQVVLNDQPGWYKGDLHCHSTHSDGSRTMEQVFDFAYSQGLDFIALTDHNAISHILYIPENQENYTDMLLLYGVEVTTYAGHFNVFNLHEYVPYQGTAPGYDINAVFDQIHAAGGYASVNHPFVPGLPGVPSAGLIYGMGWGFMDTNWSKVDFYEAFNGAERWGTIPNLGNVGSLVIWDLIENSGERLPIRGGSDDHTGGQGSGDLFSPVGAPATVVYAENLSQQAILDAIAAGHCFISTPGPDGPELYFEATAGVETVMMGDELTCDSLTLEIRVVGGNGLTLDVIKNASPMTGYKDILVDGNDFSLDVPIDGDVQGRYRAELYDGIILQAITNPIYVESAAPDDDDDDNDDDNDDDDNDDNDDDDNDNNDDDNDDDDTGGSDGDDDDDDSGCCG